MIVIYLSFWLFKHKETFNNLKLGLIPLGIILGATAALIAMQPDLSAALTVLILGVVMFFIAGGKLENNPDRVRPGPPGRRPSGLFVSNR